MSFGASYNYYYQNPDLKVLVVTNDNEQTVNEYLQKWDLDFEMVSDKNMDIANYFGIKEWTNDSDGSHVYIVNKDNKIIYANYDYKGEGEKLKTVQSELYSLLNIKDNVAPFVQTNPLMTGDDAKGFSFQYIASGDNGKGTQTGNGKLSDYLGKKNVLIAFYPAAYSVSCSYQASSFDQYAEKQKMLDRVSSSSLNNDGSLEILMVSVSNADILAKWKNEMNFQNIKLVNDVNGEISMMYNSYSQYGYNKRTLFLVDKEGKISYINWDYKVDDDDFALMRDKITALR
jgi:peroxiredoxin